MFLYCRRVEEELSGTIRNQVCWMLSWHACMFQWWRFMRRATASFATSLLLSWIRHSSWGKLCVGLVDSEASDKVCQQQTCSHDEDDERCCIVSGISVHLRGLETQTSKLAGISTPRVEICNRFPTSGSEISNSWWLGNVMTSMFAKVASAIL